MREAAKQARAALGLDTAKAPSSGRGAKQSEGSGRRRVVAVDRPPEVDEARSQLPIIGMEQEIVESVLENDAVVLSGETGCGKTTQVMHCWQYFLIDDRGNSSHCQTGKNLCCFCTFQFWPVF